MNQLDVFYHGEKIGYFIAGAKYTFIYDRSFITRGLELSPFSMPLAGAPYTFNGAATDSVPTLLLDSLPGTHASKVMDQWFRKKFDGAYSPNYLEKLAYIGSFGMGALEYRPTLDRYDRVAREVDVRLQDQFTRENIGKNSASELRRLTLGVGGYQPKVLASQHLSSHKFFEYDYRLTKEYRHIIIKFRPEKTSFINSIPEIEHVYHQMASECGITVAQSELYKDQGARTHFLSIRFDRDNDGRKVHMATLHGLLGRKMKEPKATYQDYLSLTRQLTRDQQQVREVVRRMIFNVLAHNCDDHSRNHSFLMDLDGSWRISPAYDLTYVDFPEGERMDQSMAVFGKEGDITKEDLIQEAERCGVPKHFTKNAIEEIAEVLSKASQHLEAKGLDQDSAMRVQRKIDLCRRVVEGKPPVQGFRGRSGSALENQIKIR